MRKPKKKSKSAQYQAGIEQSGRTSAKRKRTASGSSRTRRTAPAKGRARKKPVTGGSVKTDTMRRAMRPCSPAVPNEATAKTPKSRKRSQILLRSAWSLEGSCRGTCVSGKEEPPATASGDKGTGKPACSSPPEKGIQAREEITKKPPVKRRPQSPVKRPCLSQSKVSVKKTESTQTSSATPDEEQPKKACSACTCPCSEKKASSVSKCHSDSGTELGGQRMGNAIVNDLDVPVHFPGASRRRVKSATGSAKSTAPTETMRDYCGKLAAVIFRQEALLSERQVVIDKQKCEIDRLLAANETACELLDKMNEEVRQVRKESKSVREEAKRVLSAPYSPVQKIEIIGRKKELKKKRSDSFGIYGQQEDDIPAAGPVREGRYSKINIEGQGYGPHGPYSTGTILKGQAIQRTPRWQYTHYGDN